MSKMRLLFKKEGRAKYISHLDLMRTFQRAFARAGISIKHTEGFNPHPYITIALPLSVGQESECELLDFELVEKMPAAALAESMNISLPEGIFVREAYEQGRKFKEIAWLEAEGLLLYDKGLPANICQRLAGFFSGNSIVISKKSKKGVSDFDIAPCIDSIAAEPVGEDKILLKAIVSAQNPSLNPEHLINTLNQMELSMCPDFAKFRRVEVYDKDMGVFR